MQNVTFFLVICVILIYICYIIMFITISIEIEFEETFASIWKTYLPVLVWNAAVIIWNTLLKKAW